MLQVVAAQNLVRELDEWKDLAPDLGRYGRLETFRIARNWLWLSTARSRSSIPQHQAPTLYAPCLTPTSKL